MQKEQDKEIISIGITIPGLVDKRTGINRTYKNLNFENKSLSLRISENLNYQYLHSMTPKQLLMEKPNLG
jgi:hypothetical protein